MPDINTQTFWDELDDEMWDELATVIILILLAGIEGGAALLPVSAQAFINFDTLYASVIEYARTYRFDWIRGITEVTRQQTITAITEWIRSGSPLSSLEAVLAPLFGEMRAKRIAVTEVTRLFARGNQMAWESTGFVNSVTWMTAEDDKVCPICSELDGTIIGIGDIDAHPPAHVNCVLPGNVVVAPDLTAAAKSFYIGRCIEITTNSGRRLSVTENHPILTARGWVAAQFVDKFDDVIIATNGERIASGVNPNYQYRPTKIEQLFSSLVMSRGVVAGIVKASSVDFNGDGRGVYGNINVVKVNGFLSSNIKPHISKSFRELDFNRTDMRLPYFDGFRPGDFFGNGHFSSFSSPVSGGDLSFALRGRHISPLQRLGLTLISGSDPSFKKPQAKSHPINSSLAGEFILRFSRNISFDKVVKVRDFDYSGHVYDLQSEIYELYTCNDIITHNCRCWIQPIVDDKAFEKVLDDILGL